MHKPSVGLSLEGLPMIGLAVVATLSFAILDWEWAAVIGLVLTFFTVNFFRDPERVVPTGQGLAVSPADGKVVKVGRAVDPATGKEAQVVCIFMNVFNVHVNRMPVAGTIKRLDYYPGLFLNASLDKASQDNERNVVRISDENDRQWTVVQIAGLIARRIICWAEEGDELGRGRRFGLIKFGSRVDLYLPDDYRHTIVLGQKVLAGQTVIARRVDKGVYILPNLLTTASMFSGFLGIIWAVQGRFEACALAILVSALFDGLDGKVARLTGTASEFGVQYDSLADLVAFGVTPAVMVYFWQLHAFGRLGLMASFLLVVCGALRLARFNLQTAVTSKKFFIGLPIPASGCILATLVLFTPYLSPAHAESILPLGCLGLAYLLSILMVSKVRYASFKEYGFVKAHPFSSMVTAILLFVLVASQPKLLGFLVLFGYMLSGIFYTLFMLRRSSKISAPASSSR